MIVKMMGYSIMKSECAAYFGLFEDDPDSVEWIECTNESCKVWCHADCLERCDKAYVCVVCQTLLYSVICVCNAYIGCLHHLITLI